MIANWVWCVSIIVLLGVLTAVAWRVAPSARLVAVAHNSVWATALALIATDLIRYSEAGPMAWSALIAGLVSFNGGVMLSRFRPSLPPRWRALTLGRRSERPFALVSARALVLLAGIYLAGFAVYLLSIHVRFGLETLVTDPGSIRSAGPESYLESVPLAARLALYIGPLLFAILALPGAVETRVPPWVRYGGAALLAISMVALLQRTNLFLGVLLLVAALLSKIGGSPRPEAVPVDSGPASRRETRLAAWKPIVASLGLGVVALASFQVVAVALGKVGTQAESTGTVSGVLTSTGLASPFFYLTAGPVAFLQLTESDNDSWPPDTDDRIVVGDYNPQTWGAATFEPVAQFLPGVRAWDTVSPFIEVPALVNVYTWLEPLYRDFRLVGVVAGMLGVGWLMASGFALRNRSPRVFWFQAALLSTVPLATFVPRANSTIFLVELALIVALSIEWPKKAGLSPTSPPPL